MSLQSHAFLVTGASRGIGRAVALALGARGATVAVHYARRDDLAREVVAAVEARGGRAFALGADLASAGAPERLVDEVRCGLEALGGQPALQGLVLSAGELVVGGLEELSAESFDRAMEVNVLAPLLVVRAALALLAPDARIVTVSAAITRRANPDVLMQSAAKAALQDASRNLAAELGPRGIGVVDVAPGVVRTDLSTPYLATPGYAEDTATATALRRIGEPEDVADAIVALLSPQARWITGQVIEAGGGYRL
ncbi:MAG TPA: SDR family oxidoreductase [Thermoleophilaceae bacterium]|nr:SDR family oxidoreductase [Thermoleophilaceae bacterium]